MTVSAHDVAAVLRERLPDLPKKKLHKLLYYCQGHHLAAFDKPLFAEAVAAWDMGPVVSALWEQERTGEIPPRRDLGEAELNTVGYVISRYGALTGADLEHLTHMEAPWLLADAARRPRESAPIRNEWIKGYFQTTGAPGGEDEVLLDAGQVRQWLTDTTPSSGPGRTDTVEEIQARLARSA
jgi:uncharacterized phage-associated protein